MTIFGSYLKNVFKKIAVGTALVLALYGPMKAQELPIAPVEKGYNAIEAAYTDNYHSRQRLLTNIDINKWGISTGYHGLNQIDGLEGRDHCARHVTSLGKSGAKTKLAAVVQVLPDTAGAIIDKKLGIRNTGLIEDLGGYGSAELASNTNAANLTFFYGRDLGERFSGELYSSTEFPFKGKLKDEISNHTELQVNKKIFENISLFVRSEMDNFDIKKSINMAGISASF